MQIIEFLVFEKKIIYNNVINRMTSKWEKEMSYDKFQGVNINPGPDPPDFSSQLISLAPGVVFDMAGWGRHFGECLQQPPPTINRGSSVIAKFVSYHQNFSNLFFNNHQVSGHPRNNFMKVPNFVTVEQLSEEKKWTIIATDADWETK